MSVLPKDIALFALLIINDLEVEPLADFELHLT